jgi:uncharacterized protein YkwD
MFPADLQNLLNAINVPIVNFNFIDIAIIIIICIYAIEGYAIGFKKGVLDFLSFLLSFIFALSFYGVFSAFLSNFLNIPKGFSNAIGFFLAAFISEAVLSVLFRFSILPLISKKTKKQKYPEELSKIVGIVPGVLSAVVLLAFILTMIVALPISPYLKNSVTESKIGSSLVLGIQGFDEQMNNVFGGAVNDALTFLTVEPKSNDSITLNFSTKKYIVDSASELEMIGIVNEERDRAGESSLVEDLALREVARNHCKDMFERGYFSHYTPDGLSPFDRMNQAGISYELAGENLALAPNTILAMRGLMNSSGHKANILSENFNKIGVGVIDGGVYGKMFCQEFSN